jgi:hypothetical protein
MRERGYVEGRNLIVERRYAGGKLERRAQPFSATVARGPV